MALPVFPSYPAPDNGAELSEQPRIASIRFGDGYAQEVGDGRNANQPDISLSWNNITSAEATILDSFLRANGPPKRFQYTLPGETDPMVWKCASWTKTWLDVDSWRVDATFTRRFNSRV